MPLTSPQFVSISDIEAGLLVYTSQSGGNGQPFDSFQFAVVDDGGTAYNGADTDPTPKTMGINVDPIVFNGTGYLANQLQLAISDAATYNHNTGNAATIYIVGTVEGGVNLGVVTDSANVTIVGCDNAVIQANGNSNPNGAIIDVENGAVLNLENVSLDDSTGPSGVPDCGVNLNTVATLTSGTMSRRPS